MILIVLRMILHWANNIPMRFGLFLFNFAVLGGNNLEQNIFIAICIVECVPI